jgi:hypothetical protein
VFCTWDDFVDRVANRLFDGHEPGTLRQASFYKIIDFKPLFAYIFIQISFSGTNGGVMWTTISFLVVFDHSPRTIYCMTMM